MMRAPVFLKLTAWVKSVLHRCKADGCWRKGMPCSEMDTSRMNSLEEIAATRHTFIWQCRDHAMEESRRP